MTNQRRHRFLKATTFALVGAVGVTLEPEQLVPFVAIACFLLVIGLLIDP